MSICRYGKLIICPIVFLMSMVLSRCEFAGQKCDADAFEVIFTDFGGCFIFNWSQKKQLSVSAVGNNRGLKLILNLEQYEYKPGVSLIDACVFVHNFSVFLYVYIQKQ